MKRLNLLLALLVVSFTIGCAKDKDSGSSSSNNNNNGGGVWIPPSSGPGLNPGTNWQYGGTTTFTPTSNFTNGFYTGYTLNSPSDFKVNINLRRYDPAPGTSRYSYGGVVTLSFKDNGRLYEDQFTSLINENHWYGSGTVSTNEENNKYNVWITKNGKQYWHGFFQDNYGSVIVVIDDADDAGDGQGPSSVSGSIWVMNFGDTYAPLSPTSCWFVSVGPYDCRTWKDGKKVNTDMDIYPYLENTTSSPTKPKAIGYRKIADFTNLEFSKAFNN